MDEADVPFVLPVFLGTNWACLNWNANISPVVLTDENKRILSLIDGRKSFTDLREFGVTPSAVQPLVEQGCVMLLKTEVPSGKREKWLVLSPHSDDAALSIGGILDRYCKSVHVEVLTLTGPSRCSGTCAPLYGNVDAVTAIRKEEDTFYGKHIGCSVSCADIEDGELYVDGDGVRWCEKIMSPPDKYRIDLFKTSLKSFLLSGEMPARIFCPMSVGAHFDHAATHIAFDALIPDIHAASPGTRMFFYEDLPYSQHDTEALHARIKEFTSIKPYLVPIDIDRKLMGVSIYRSQYTEKEISSDLFNYSTKISDGAGGHFERVWEKELGPTNNETIAFY